MAQNEVVIRIDDYLTAATDIYDLDPLKLTMTTGASYPRSLEKL